MILPRGRIVSYVVSGVGFLGAGVIFKEGGNVRGLNTAATIWCSAAIGALSGGHLAAFFEGDVEVTGDIRLTNADCAEDFDIAGADLIEAGTVVVLGDEGSMAPSRRIRQEGGRRNLGSRKLSPRHRSRQATEPQ